jgi:RNA polymerase sigma factor (sigma-70 family)
MASNRSGLDFRSIRALFNEGSVAGVTDRQLLERFTTRDGDGADVAFASLVDRHGPMVLRLCRKVLRDRDEADDAFQATFFILAIKAGSIRDRDSLVSWLYSVAYNVAATARSSASRRRSHELRAAETRSLAYIPHTSDELTAAVHEELDRIPERYRAVIVLCCLEGLTHVQAARQLGWPLGTVQSRLARGRQRLRARLARRGLDPSAAVGLLPLSSEGIRVVLSPSLAASTVRVALTLGGTQALATGIVPVAVINLAKGAMSTMFVSKLATIGTAALVAAGFMAAGAAVYCYRPVKSLAITAQAEELMKGAPPTVADLASGLPSIPDAVRVPDNPPVPNMVPRGALRIAKLKHRGDWNFAPRALPDLIEFIREPALKSSLTITQHELLARDPNLIYYPFIYVNGRAPIQLDNDEIEALGMHLEPGGGIVFADAAYGSAAFDASFRELVAKLVPGHRLVPIPTDDELFSAKFGFDLSDAEYTRAAGGGKGFPQLEGVRLNDYWAIVYSKYDLGCALEGRADAACKGYTHASARRIAANVVIHSTLP